MIRSVISDEEARKKNYAFVYLDLDHFKYYNDTFGHHVGDAILVKFADIFKQKALKSSVVIRLGGDEFAILASYKEQKEILTKN